MVSVKTYTLAPTRLIPNSPLPLIHYPALLSDLCPTPTKIYDLFQENNWQTQWIFRYGPTQTSHYHSSAHECMVVLAGTATIRFGAADTDPDLEASTHGTGHEEGGVEIHAQTGDVFVVPAGVAHKTFDTTSGSTFKLLTPGDGHAVSMEAVQETEIGGFAMMGAYPVGSRWDFKEGGEADVEFESVWDVEKPGKDPVLGEDGEGICGLWKK